MSKSIKTSQSESQSSLDQALTYAEWGWCILPMHSIDPNDGCCTCGRNDCRDPGKHPLTEHGCKDATADEELIRQWHEETQGCCNWGIATGEQSGLLVIDADDVAGFETLAQKYGPLPVTPTVQTGRDPIGKHFYFKYPEGSGITIGTGKVHGLPFDWRGEGGLVVAPPSLHRSGRRYTWLVPMHHAVQDLGPRICANCKSRSRSRAMSSGNGSRTAVKPIQGVLGRVPRSSRHRLDPRAVQAAPNAF